MCIAGLWLISPADDSAARQEQLAAAQHRLAAVYAELDAVRRDARDQLREAADTADKQAQALKAAGQKQDALAGDLDVAQRVIDSFRSKAALSDEARSAMAASLSKANRELDEERQRLALVQGELAQASDAGTADKARADKAEAMLAGAAKARQATEAALADQAKARQAAETALADAAEARKTAEAGSRQAADALKDDLKLESARADAAARELDSARRERDAAIKVSAELTAALEEARGKVIGMAVNLTAARKAIDLVKARQERRSARIVQTPAAPAVAASASDQPARQRVAEARAKPRPVVQRSPKRVQVATTITLPDALLPSQPSD